MSGAVVASIEAAQQQFTDGVQLVNGADLRPEPIEWLWKHWLALGKFHLLAGAPGVGKTTLALGLAATVTLGGRFPDGERCEPGNVLIWSGEDDPADTLLPRLVAAGADRSRCYFVSGTRVDGETMPFDPARDLVQLTAAAERIGGVALLIVDPVVSVVTGDSHKNPEVRRALQPLVDLAGVLRCAVLGITHFAKAGQGLDPTQRVIGSVAFSAVSRIVMVAAKTKGLDGQPARVLARSKSNIGPDDGGFHYDLVQREAMPGIEASCVAWGAAVAGTARELLVDPDAPGNEDEEGEDSAQQSAEKFLRELLADCPVPAKQVKADANDAGVAWRTVRRAADALGVVRKKGGMDAGWYWRLPEGVQETLKMPNKKEWAPSRNLDTFGDASTDPATAASPAADSDAEVFE